MHLIINTSINALNFEIYHATWHKMKLFCGVKNIEENNIRSTKSYQEVVVTGS